MTLLYIIAANLGIMLFNLIGMSLDLRGPFIDWYLHKGGIWWILSAAIVVPIIAGALT